LSVVEMSARRLAELVRRGELSPLEVGEAFLDRTSRIDPVVRAFVSVTADRVRRDAERAGRAPSNGCDGPLCGVPVALKDNLCTRGVRTTCSSRMLEGFVPPYDATVVERLYAAGAVFLGKTNMDEFAMGSSTENSAFFPTRNPWDPRRVPGGSSGGSAAAVAAGEAPYAIGSDTGGSVRQPASFCGVVGMKPTYGRVSRYGLVAFASSLDQIGPITRDVVDCALVMNVISGHDPRDSTSSRARVPDYVKDIDRGVKGMRFGVPREYFGEGVDRGVREVVREAIGVLESLGASAEECSLPATEYALPAYYIIAPAEASSNLARYDGVRYGYRSPRGDGLSDMYVRTRREGFGAEVKRRIMLGTFALSTGYYEAYYLKAQKVRTLVKRDFERAFEKYDVLLAPTSPTVAFKIGEHAEDPLSMYMADELTIPANLAGIPALSVPCGLHDGLPVGLQVLGPPFEEARILRVARAYEQASGGPLPLPEIEQSQEGGRQE